MLTTIEALNVEADELTHVARKLPDIKEYHKFPTNQVNLKINNQYINSHYPKMVNLAFHSMALREYYISKYRWTIDSLWWPIYFQSLAKLSDPDKLCIQKFVDNRLPTLYWDQKYNKNQRAQVIVNNVVYIMRMKITSYDAGSQLDRKLDMSGGMKWQCSFRSPTHPQQYEMLYATVSTTG
jgi:hypothetical protein